MTDKNKFQEMLKDILEVARVQGNVLTMKEIKELFGDMELNDMQYEHIYGYIVAHQINIEGFVGDASEYQEALVQENRNIEKESKKAILDDEEYDSQDDEAYNNQYGAYEIQNNMKVKEFQEVKNSQKDLKRTSMKDFKKISQTQFKRISKVDTDRISKVDIEKISQKDSLYLQMYLEDLSAIKSCTIDQEIELVSKICEGDMVAKNRYIEVQLRAVVYIAKEYVGKGMTIEDLIQEGNMGLMAAVDKIPKTLEHNSNIKSFVLDYVRGFIEDAIQDQDQNYDFEDKLIKKTEFLNNLANDLAEEMGRAATLSELSAYAKISEQELVDLLNMSADAVKVK